MTFTQRYIRTHAFSAFSVLQRPNCLFVFVLIGFCDISGVRIMEGKGEGHDNMFNLKSYFNQYQRRIFHPFLYVN